MIIIITTLPPISSSSLSSSSLALTSLVQRVDRGTALKENDSMVAAHAEELAPLF